MRRMRNDAFRRAQWQGRYAQHVGPINELVDEIRARKGLWAPYVAPCHGGTVAAVLSVLQDPGPKTEEVGGSGMLCVENDDDTAQAQAELFAAVGIDLGQLTPWNIYPWRLGRPPTAAELDEGAEVLAELIALMPGLRVVLLQGGSAQRGWNRLLRRQPRLLGERAVVVEKTYHPGRQALWTPDADERARRLAHRRSAHENIARLLAVLPDDSAPPEAAQFRAQPGTTTARRDTAATPGNQTPVSLPPAVGLLADWSSWVPLAAAATTAPVLPGVYIAREGAGGPVVYVGMAGDRPSGSPNRRGLRGRLRVYASGKAAVSGLGEATLDRALADADWLTDRIAEVQAGRPSRAQSWSRLALQRADVHVCWASTNEPAAARALEEATLAALHETDLWNRRR